MLAALLGRIARLFYRRIEAAGLEHAPRSGPVLFVANHANGLVDPMLVLALVRRPITFVAKSTLWRIPVLGTLLKALGAVPVVRRVDAMGDAAAKANDESLARLAAALDAGRAVLIFPEGRSHSDPALSPIRTGAARVLLMAHGDAPVVPVGLWFQRKEEFRSDVLVRFGAPVLPARDGTSDVAGWTRAIEEGLRGVTLNAESWSEHEAAAAVDAIYGSSLPAEDASELERAFRNRRLLLEARRSLARVEPDAVARLSRRARALARFAERTGLDPSAPPAASRTGLLPRLALLLGLAIVRLPAVALGVAAFWVPYRLTGIVTGRIFAGRDQRDQIALWKILVGAALHLSALALEVGAVAFFLGAPFAAFALVLLPACGLFALEALEETERDVSRLRTRFLSKGAALLARERDALVAECDRLAAVYAGLPSTDAG